MGLIMRPRLALRFDIRSADRSAIRLANSSAVIRIVALMMAVALAVPAAAQNVRIISAHFKTTADAGDKRARQVAWHLEQMHFLFGELLARDRLYQSLPVELVAMKSAQDMQQILPQSVPGAGAHSAFFGLDDKRFILVDAETSAIATPQPWATAMRDYGRFLLKSNYPPTPPWFNEGFSRYFAAIELVWSEKSPKAFLGRTPSGVSALPASQWMPLEQVLSQSAPDADATSGDSSSKGAVSGNASASADSHADASPGAATFSPAFLYESWALVRYLEERSLMPQAAKYFELTMRRKQPVAAAVQSAFAMPINELQNAVAAYAVTPVSAGSNLPQMEIDTFQRNNIKPFEWQIVMDDLRVHTASLAASGRMDLERLVDAHPESAEAQRAYGIALIGGGDLAKAAAHFRRAIELGTDDPNAYYWSAVALVRGGGKDPQTLANIAQAVEHALTINPQFTQAWVLRANALADAGNWPEAALSIRNAVRISPRILEYQLDLARYLAKSQKYDEALAILKQLQGSDDKNIAARATADAADVADWKAHPDLAYERQQQQRNIAGGEAIGRSNEEMDKWLKLHPNRRADLERIENAQNTGTDWDVTDDPTSPQRKQSTTSPGAKALPVKTVTGTLLRTDCSASPAGVLHIQPLKSARSTRMKTGSRIILLTTTNVAGIDVGGSRLSCTWRGIKVKATYAPKSTNGGDLVSLEVMEGK